MSRRLPAIAACAVSLLICSPSFAADKMTIWLDWFLNPDHTPLVVAQEQGFFRDAELDVTLTAPADPNDPPKLLAAGEADLALSYQPQLYLQVAAGLPLVRIATLVSTPLNTVMALKDGPIKTLADLKGRKVGYSVGGFEDAVLSTMLGTAGLTLKDVELINVNFSLVPPLLSGQVDAVIGGFRNVEAQQMTLEGKPAQLFFPEENGVPPYDELIVLARSNELADPRLPRFLAALEAATLWTLNHPDEARALLIKGRPELDDELNRRAYAATLPRFAHDPAALDRGRYERFAAYLKAHDLIATVPPLDSYARALR
ncbi:MAG: ABC transporter substrate-binding protein [Azospirillaceae bacterium]|nr:ABC transporter substrate-binding protein [Azospirillaceae bacterium]